MNYHQNLIFENHDYFTTQNTQNFIGYYSPTNEIITSENGLFTSNFYSYSPPQLDYSSTWSSSSYSYLSSFTYFSPSTSTSSSSSNESSEYTELVPSIETLSSVQDQKTEEDASLNLDFTSMFSIPADDYIKTFVQQHQNELIIPLIDEGSSSGSKCQKCQYCSNKKKKKAAKTQETKPKPSVARTKTPKEPVECAVCKKVFRAQWYLKQHLKVHHLNEKKSFRCKKCGKCFSTADELDVHAIKHTSVNQFKCDECPKSFVHKQDLKRHQYNHSVKPFPCEMCPKRFARKDALVQHELSCLKRIKKQKN